MLFEETFSFPASIILMVSIIAILFSWRLYSFIRIPKSLYSLPSVIVLGPRTSGKTTLVKELAPNINFSFSHATKKLGYSIYSDGKKKVQFVDPEKFSLGKLNRENVEEFKKLNYKSLIYLFNISPGSEPIEKQIRGFKKTMRLFGRVNLIPVATKLEKLKQMVKNIRKISLHRKDGLVSLRNSVFASIE